jgi:hypothetical protein
MYPSFKKFFTIAILFFAFLQISFAQQQLAVMQLGRQSNIAVPITQIDGQTAVIINNQAFPVVRINEEIVVIINGEVIIIIIVEFAGRGSNFRSRDSEVIAIMNVRVGTWTQVYLSLYRSDSQAITMTPREIEQLTPSQQSIIIEQLSPVQTQQLTPEQAQAFGLINGQGQEQPPRRGQQLSTKWQNTLSVDNSTVTQSASANLTATTNSTNITASQLDTATASAASGQATAAAESGKKFKRDSGSIWMKGLMKERSNLGRVVKA